MRLSRPRRTSVAAADVRRGRPLADQEGRAQPGGGLPVRTDLVEEVHVGEEHPPAAVPGEAELREDLARGLPAAGPLTVLVPGLADDRPTGEAAHRDHHRHGSFLTGTTSAGAS